MNTEHTNQSSQAEPVNQQLLALAKSFGHKVGCAKNAFGEQCTCGADEAIAAAEQAQADHIVEATEMAQQVEPVGHFTGEFAGCGDILEFVVRAHGPLPTAGAKLYTKPPAVAVPEGYALVPIEPTPEMVAAGAEGDSQFYDHASFVYRAMLAAAPQAAVAVPEIKEAIHGA